MTPNGLSIELDDALFCIQHQAIAITRNNFMLETLVPQGIPILLPVQELPSNLEYNTHLSRQ